MPVGTASGAVADAVRAAVATSGLQASMVAISAIDMASGAPVASVEAGRLMVPASNMKVLTTGAALHVLGPGWSFRTRLVRAGDRLAVIGDGDPSLGDPDLAGNGRPGAELADGWARAVRAAGIAKAAELVVDDRIFDREWTHPSWPEDQLDNSYCAQVSGLSFHENLAGAYLGVAGGRPTVSRWEPSAPWITVDQGKATAAAGKQAGQSIALLRTEDPWRFRLSGNMKSVPQDPLQVCVRDMPAFFAQHLAARLAAAGVAVGRARTAAPGDPSFAGGTVLAEATSPIAMVIERCNEDSQNMYAESLLKRIGAARSRAPGTWTNGCTALAAAIDERLGAGTAARYLVASDGSGLSRDNRVAPALLAAWLRSVALDPALGGPFLESLAVGGREGTVRKRFQEIDHSKAEVRCKTGYINGVSCLTGYVGRPGQPPRYAFSVMCNGVGGVKNGIAAAKDLQERVARILANAL